MGVALERLETLLSRSILIPSHPSVSKSGKPIRVKAHWREIPDSVTAQKASAALRRPKKEGGGGFSINKNGNEPKSGFMVSLVGAEVKVSFSDVTVDLLDEYLAEHKEDLADPKRYFGGWLDRKNRVVYLDVSENVKSREEAIKRGKTRKQEAIFDVAEADEVRLSRADAKEVVYLPTTSGKAAYDALMAAIEEGE